MGAPFHHAAPIHHAAPFHHAPIHHAPIHHAPHVAVAPHPAAYAPAPAPIYKPAPAPIYKPAPAPTYKPAPVVHAPAPYKPAPAYHEPAYKEEPKPYAFQYGVADDYSGAKFSASETADGKAVTGSYSVALPDGRIQTVTYTADHYNGYVADVSYEGVPVYPEAKPYHPAPAPAYHAAPKPYAG